MELTQEIVRELFDYRNDGKLIWKCYRSHNARRGDVAGFLKDNGYLYVSIFDRKYLVHRVIFLWHHGYFPDQVDHINTVRTDNRIENLRKASRSQNMHNTRARSNNTSGFKGVSWCKRKLKWRMSICVNYRQIFGGYFDTAEAAHEAYKKAADKYHGEFARAA